MPITVSWNDRTKTHIESRFDDPWTVTDLLEVRKAWYRMIKSVNYRVPILLDWRESRMAPEGALRQFSAIHRTPHQRQGHIYIIGYNPYLESLSQHIFDGVIDSDKSVRFIDSVESIVSS